MSKDRPSVGQTGQKDVDSILEGAQKDRDAQIARYRSMLSVAYQEHWRELDRLDTLSPYFSYSMVEEIGAWPLPMMGDQLLSSDFNELINAVNAWNHRLRSWEAWNRVLAKIADEHDRWDVRSEFVEPLVYFCLHQPAGTRDRLTRFATRVVHVGNMRVVAGYKDELAEDAKVFKRLQQGHPKPHSVFLSRGEAEAQFREKSKEWRTADALISLVSQLDIESYREATGDWRNRAAHGIPQHFEFGQVERVSRWVEFETTLVKVAGGVEFKEDRSRKSISYNFGGVEALNLGEVHVANRAQFGLARQAMDACEALLREVGSRLGAVAVSKESSAHSPLSQ